MRVSVCRVFVPSGMQGRDGYEECVLSCEVGVCQDSNSTTGCMITTHIHTSIRCVPHPQKLQLGVTLCQNADRSPPQALP